MESPLVRRRLLGRLGRLPIGALVGPVAVRRGLQPERFRRDRLGRVDRRGAVDVRPAERPCLWINIFSLQMTGLAVIMTAMEPMRLEDYISFDHYICHGKPCFRGSRIMVSTILELIESGRTFKEIKRGYPSLTPRHVQAALHFAHRLVETVSSRSLRAFQHAFAHR